MKFHHADNWEKCLRKRVIACIFIIALLSTPDAQAANITYTGNGTDLHATPDTAGHG